MTFSDRKDRGMKKWGGFLLSEHTEHIEASAKQPVWRKVQEEEEISQILQHIIQNRLVAAMQLFKAEGESPDADIEGRIVATEGSLLHVQTVDTLKVIEFESIRNVEERSYLKWYEK
ncbi:hypothetical protein [Listeria booriae]|uniref:hypothetical protein n=1 Tax=Listeria booriae TaxID=1552123 RepID=UPI0016298A77|nr:hypothetical protein [Listeria booriae]MBC1212471.1 hypothetical protein [Listeria booriae]MBC1287293.1 hypothetical protein [Listeria booriae]MBC1309346.1 hypothetical protein [Listeria booriae]